MSNSKKVTLKSLIIFLLVSLMFIPMVYADDEPLSSQIDDTGEYEVDKIHEISSSVWTTAKTIVQVVAFCGIIFTGISYMLASSSDKADKKKSMGYVFLGLVLVFGTATFVDLIYKIADEIL